VTVVATRHSERVRRFAAIPLLLSLALVAGACASRDDGTGVFGYGDPDETTPATVDDATKPSEPPSTSPPTTSSRAPSGGGSPRTTERPNDAPAPAAPPETATTVAPPRRDDGRLGGAGAYARTLLRPTPATELAVDVIVEPGTSIRASTTSYVERVLSDVTRKPVSLTVRTAASTGPGEWNETAINAYADRHASIAVTDSRAVIRFLALRGGFAGQRNAIGVAVRGDVFALFVEKVNGAASPLVDAATIEQAVAVHEVGHLLGLVDIALDRKRADPDHPYHSRNRESVMFWAIETDLVSQVLGGPPPRTFDNDDLADLAALRSGA